MLEEERLLQSYNKRLRAVYAEESCDSDDSDREDPISIIRELHRETLRRSSKALAEVITYSIAYMKKNNYDDISKRSDSVDGNISDDALAQFFIGKGAALIEVQALVNDLSKDIGEGRII